MKSKLCKRVTDVCLAGVGLLLAAPIFAVVSLLIWLDEPGSVLFAQTRLGLNGKPFQLLKFRKFSAKCGDAGPGVTVAGDARMTAIGAILERTKLDELPQLWNLLKGEMSFVGPRPESMRFADLYQGEYVRLLDFLPGLFGPCQIAFRNESALYPKDENPEVFYRCVLFPQKAKIDLDYFPRSTCLGDFSWMFRGLWVTLAGAFDWRKLFVTYGKTVVTDTVIVLLSWIVATLLHFSTIPQGSDYPAFILGLWVLPPTVISGLVLGGCYKSYGEGYFYFADAVKLIYLTTVSLGVAFLAILAFESRSVSLFLVPIEWLVLLAGLAMPRIWFRFKREKTLAGQQDSAPPVFVYGANASGIALANWLTCGQKKRVLAFFDDESKFHGKQLMGLPVLSRTSDILTFQAEYKASELWVARQLSEESKINIANFCRSQKIKLVMMPEVEPFSRLDEAASGSLKPF
jgi:lipopolysaccharide/colanic/teichoic acid biosynthesis glycosyltransferase